MMPRVNGFELLTALAAEVPRPRPVILVMTACDEPALRQLDPEVVHGIVRKPFDVQSLAGTIRASALLYPTLPPARAAAAVKAMARIMLCICSGCKP
jgi:DNA-binding NarL/FixJ family response regulator